MTKHDYFIWFSVMFIGGYILLWPLCFFLGLVEYGLWEVLTCMLPIVVIIELIALWMYSSRMFSDVARKLKNKLIAAKNGE